MECASQLRPPKVGEVRKALREEKPAAAQLRGAPVEHGVDAGREGRALHRDPPVALDEHEQDVLAPQAGKQPVAGSGAEGVVGDLARERRAVRQAVPHRLHLVDGQGDGARGGDRRADDAESHPDHAQRRRRPERPAAVAGRDPRHAQRRQDLEGEERDGEHHRDGDGDVRARAADRVTQRLDADPRVPRVVDWPERPVERREKPEVEDLHEHEHAQQRSHAHGQHAARGGGQQGGHGDDDEELEGEPRERAEGEAARTVRRHEGGPNDQQGEDGERQGDAAMQRPTLGLTDVTLRHLVVCGLAVAPQPPRALADRRHEQGERGDQEGLREGPGQDPGGRDRQHDPLRRRDDPAPAARRQRRAHPRQQPRAGEEQVACGPDREHPCAVRGGDVDAEGEDQERVDLGVEARPQRGRRPGAPRHQSVDRVERERDCGERHEQRDRRAVRERARGQRSDADGERGPGERHPGRRPEPVTVARP